MLHAARFLYAVACNLRKLPVASHSRRWAARGKDHEGTSMKKKEDGDDQRCTDCMLLSAWQHILSRSSARVLDPNTKIDWADLVGLHNNGRSNVKQQGL